MRTTCRQNNVCFFQVAKCDWIEQEKECGHFNDTEITTLFTFMIRCSLLTYGERIDCLLVGRPQ
jgi:hypothetical protein